MVKKPRKRRGATAGVPEAIQLVTDWPLSGDMANPTELTRTDFDNWAEHHGYYQCHYEAATVGMLRGNLCNKIRRGAASPNFTVLGHESYDIQIKGDTYKLVPSYEAMRKRMDALSARLKGYTSGKLEVVRMIYDSVDHKILPWQFNWHLKSLLAQGDSLKDHVLFGLDQLSKGLAMARQDLTEQVKLNPELLKIEGIVQFLAMNGDHKRLPAPQAPSTPKSAEDLFRDLFGDPDDKADDKDTDL